MDFGALAAYNARFTTKRAGYYRPFFLVDPIVVLSDPSFQSVALHELVENTVTGLGYDMVEIERTAGGTLRITIDFPWVAASTARTHPLINVEDCERVTRQLQYVLEVDGVEYKRLEVSSPGIDRLLRGEADLNRFQGEMVDLVLRAPIGAASAGQVNANRKKFRGRLERQVQSGAVEGEAVPSAGWQVCWSDAPAAKPGQKISKKRAAVVEQVLGFVWSEVREVRLAAIVDFKGRAGAGALPDLDDGADAVEHS
jgi:ribosome maturation factor RimP